MYLGEERREKKGKHRFEKSRLSTTEAPSKRPRDARLNRTSYLFAFEPAMDMSKSVARFRML